MIRFAVNFVLDFRFLDQVLFKLQGRNVCSDSSALHLTGSWLHQLVPLSSQDFFFGRPCHELLRGHWTIETLGRDGTAIPAGQEVGWFCHGECKASQGTWVLTLIHWWCIGGVACPGILVKQCDMFGFLLIVGKETCICSTVAVRYELKWFDNLTAAFLFNCSTFSMCSTVQLLW